MSSIGGSTDLGRGNFVYSVTKGGINAFTRELAVEWASHKIRVNALQPVQMLTPSVKKWLEDPKTDPALMPRLLSGVPLGRLGLPGDVVGPAAALPGRKLMTYAMQERLTRDNLHGIWAAMATPFDAQDRFDEDVFRENIRRLHAAGVHGIYTTDSDGEFYAIELEEFKRVVKVFADETQRLGCPTMVGVTWCNTQGIIDRLKFAADQGILGAHVGHPFFMPMAADSYRAFWVDVQRAAPEWFALVHYNTPRLHNYRRGPDYIDLLDIPNLVGTKHVGADFPESLTLMASVPQLSHFTGEHAMTPYMMFGARGCIHGL